MEVLVSLRALGTVALVTAASRSDTQALGLAIEILAVEASDATNLKGIHTKKAF